MMSSGNNIGITRDEALSLLKEHIKNERTISHCLASEAIMRALARRFSQDEELWGIAGLLHDLDYEIVNEDEYTHGKVAAEMLGEKGCCEALSDVIAKHNAEGLGLERTTQFEHALTCAESITGLITATALVQPDKKLSSVKPKSVKKRMKQTAFARAVSRERVLECEDIGVPIAEFCALGVEAMQEIADDLGL
ncbi:HDIG domain-containing metalloprotein [Desulfatibacillum aliphaticivorans]|nr:HDIG domain-containing metalloprotein [Desulfatibacillum aliphaticivorans]